MIFHPALAVRETNEDPGAWALDALHLMESVNCDFANEVAEWTSLYAKELCDV